MSRVSTLAKQKLIDLGVYRPARKLFDALNRGRARKNQRRKAFYRELIRPNDLVFDVGANIGDYTDTFVSLGARVVAVEPQPSCLTELHARFGNRITIAPVAVGARKGTGELYLREHSVAAGFIKDWDPDWRPIGSIKVPIATLDSLIHKHGTPHYLKIDIEGYELQAFNGLHISVNLVSFEYHLSRSDIADKILIVERLKLMGAKRFSILGEDATSWSVPWTDIRDFPELFPAQVSNFLGDIFVSTD